MENYTVLLKVITSTTANKMVKSIFKNVVSALDIYTSCYENCQGENGVMLLVSPHMVGTRARSFLGGT